MIRKEVIDLVQEKTKFVQRNFIEKDMLLHRLLIELSSHKDFMDNYAFKGGTCLVKCYIDYYRFSEDLDFTYIHQDEFINKSGKQLSKMFSEKAGLLLKIIESVAHKIGFDFKAVKNDKRYVEFGASNKNAKFKLWYIPEGEEKETYIKIELNFLEKIEFPIVMNSANHVLFGKHDKSEASFLLPNESEWMFNIPRLKCYNVKEILIEKIRAILTRRVVKSRDYIDIYMIEKKSNIDVRDFKSQIIEKVKAVMKFEKYKANFENMKLSDFSFEKLEDEQILLIKINMEEFDAFFKRLNVFLRDLAKDII